jgi:phage tail-like protein
MYSAPTTNGQAPPAPEPTNAERDVEKLGENHFVLKLWNLEEIGAFREITGLQMEREILEYAEGGCNDFVNKLPGRVKHPNLVLKRGVTDQCQLVEWFQDSQITPVRMDVSVTLVDPALKPVREWMFEQAYPVKWIGPNLNAGSDSPATEQLELAHSGFTEVPV